MIRKKYEKPTLYYSKIESVKSVANRCWAPPSGDYYKGFYNDPGFGGVKFQMSSDKKSCGNQLTVLGFVDNAGKQHGLDYRSEYIALHPGEYTEDDFETKLYEEVILAVRTGHNEAQNFDAQGKPVYPDGPNPPHVPWSI